MICIHYKICVLNDHEYLCNDSKCLLNIKQYKKELIDRRQSVRDYMDSILKELGVKNFLELNGVRKWKC